MDIKSVIALAIVATLLLLVNYFPLPPKPPPATPGD
jgi:hypothetical protein